MSLETRYNIPESQINEINNLLIEYSVGNYSYTGKLSDQRDEIDTIIEAVNVLGQELNATTVSRDYFLSIFNSSTNLVCVVDAKGNVLTRNARVSDFYEESMNQIDDFFAVFSNKIRDYEPFWELAYNRLLKEDKIQIELYAESTLISSPTFFSVGLSVIENSYGKVEGYLIVAEDITDKKEAGRRLQRASMESQQKEQRRVAKDLHDAIGQELSALSMLVSNLKSFIDFSNEDASNLYDTSKSILKNSIGHLREICFDLMPSALQKGNLVQAVKQLAGLLSKQSNFQVDLEVHSKEEDISKLDSLMALNIYRIIQEFINNTIKYANANKVFIEMYLDAHKKVFEVLIKDNGEGFDVKKAIGKGNGLQNYQTRVDVFKGNAYLESKIGKGTSLELKIPFVLDH